MQQPDPMGSRWRSVRIPGVVLAGLGCVLLYLASLGTTTIRGAFPELAATISGTFPPDGQFHGEPLADAVNVRVWGSLVDRPEHVGTVALGSFPAPARLRFGVTGHPISVGNQLAVERPRTGERLPVLLPADIGARWNVVDFDLPPSWVGQPVRLLATDGSPSTWLGISEPIAGGRGEGNHGLRQTLATWAINGLVLGLLGLAVADALARRGVVEDHWIPLVAAGAVATLGYGCFWISFAHATAGRIVAVTLLLLATTHALRRGRSAPPGAETARVARLMLGVGTFYVALLHLYPSSAEFDGLAANRFRENLPGDNTLPYNLAAALAHGREAKSAGGDYQSSDRPPLQAGWLLLTWPVTQALGCNERGAAGTAAMWFQLLWIPAAYGLFRTLRLTAARAITWTAIMALSGFLLQNTVFTWPKLSAAAFAIGAFALWLMPSTLPRTRLRFGLGAALAALAWLSHGGVAFSFLALLPWILWRLPRGEFPAWLLAAGVFAIFAAPWTLYQTFYDPPGNLLLKEHLAGVDERDPRSTWQTIRDSYRAIAWPEIIARKRANLALQVEGNWRALLEFSRDGATARRADEFFHPARALTWWLLAPLLLGVALLRRRARSPAPDLRPWHAALLLWSGLTLVVWCLLMFRAGHAVIHQGSYVPLLGLFVLGSTWLEHAGRWTAGLVAALQTATLATTYAVSNVPIHGPPVGAGLLIVAGCALAGIVGAELRAEPPSRAPA